MTRMIKTFLAGAAFTAFAATAVAEAPVKADFTYSPTAPVSTTYAAFIDTAKAACRVSPSEVRQLGARMRMQEACTETLLAKAVAATQNQSLIAFHGEQIGDPAARRQMAALTR